MTDERKKSGRWYRCKECGHEWYSYSLGLRVVCPECAKRRSGTSRKGASAETLAKARAAKAAKRAAREAEVNSAPKGQEPTTTPQQEKKQSILDRILNKEIL